MIKHEQWQGRSIVTLENDKLLISLCPSLGNNLYRMWDKAAEREILRVPAGPQALIDNPGHFGTPLMMPPNRIRNGRFEYEGQAYQFDINTPNGHHIHGFLRNHAWEVTNTADNSGTLSVTSVLDTTAHQDIFAQYPHEMRIEMTYELSGTTLVQRLRATNGSGKPAPFGYGVHTWFALDNEPEKWTLTLPVESIWELDGDLMPTGERKPLGDLSDIARGINLRGRDLDTVFQIGDNPCEAVLSKEGCEIRYRGEGPFKQWVIFTKGIADEIICLEPYTWVTNAPNLPLDPEITGLRAIAPGETLALDIVMEISHGGKSQ
ncbi:aldose 1-epimerase [Paenibacillus contaminans]|uniref:Aldose 1-epimerase n=1 Tax=Paenibacillus contaminans TaxID=450362 RepID=A0A329M2T9_9BACL|nr:aldose 1-epimerase [Paenibacillus contaminans]RAV14429.1 aldose 1-epimerase [Paenibacillus contaminans]